MTKLPPWSEHPLQLYVTATHINCLAFVNKPTVNKYNAFPNYVLGMTNRTEAIIIKKWFQFA